MKAIIRKYSGKGAREVFDALERDAAELEPTMRAVKGLVSYTLARSGDGGFSVTVCEDEAGLEESTRIAREWIAKHVAGAGAAPPEVTAGAVIVHLQ
jgi:hypothetical protein